VAILEEVINQVIVNKKSHMNTFSSLRVSSCGWLEVIQKGGINNLNKVNPRQCELIRAGVIRINEAKDNP
jgi:hypothetical protein